MPDKVKPLKVEKPSDGTETDPFPTEADPTEDYIAAKGFAFENLDTHLMDRVGNDLRFTDPTSGAKLLKNLLDAEFENFDPTGTFLSSTKSGPAIREAANQASAAIFTIPIIWNGTASGSFFFSYNNLTPSTPLIVPKNCTFTGFTFSNEKTNPDFTIEIRKNTDAGAALYTVSKVNTQYFAQTLPSPISFSAGDRISVKYVDDGNNSRDVCVLLFFRAGT